MLQYNVIKETDIPQLRKKRHKTKFGSCYMTRGIFAGASGKLCCSCMIGYYTELGDIRNTHAGRFCSGPIIRYIAESFRDGLEPFAMCYHCATRQSEGVPEHWLRKNRAIEGLTIHVEPSTYCNLFCEACLCTAERKAADTPSRRNMPFELYHKMLHELKEAGVKVGNLVFAGFGEPLFNKDVPKMVYLARELYPASHISLDTNGNFGSEKAMEIATCGLNQVRLALDGADQESYSAYRAGGDFQMAIQFTSTLAEAIRASRSRTRPVWKYILFKHNDRDELLKKAKKMADEYGVQIIYDVSVGPLASQRDHTELRKSIEDIVISYTLDEDAYENMRSPLDR